MNYSPEYGVRQFVNLIVSLLQYYQRHKVNIDEHLNPELVGALELLLAALPIIAALNAVGPNPISGDLSP